MAANVSGLAADFKAQGMVPEVTGAGRSWRVKAGRCQGGLSEEVNFKKTLDYF